MSHIKPQTAIDSYTPLNQIKPVDKNIWIVDGPIIKMNFPLGFKIPFPTRMVVMRLNDGRLWVHSPIAPDEGLFAQIDALGEVAFPVAPNSIHYWHLPDWVARYPQAQIYLVPGLDKSAKRPLPDGCMLGHHVPEAWATDMEMLLFRGSLVNEAVFFHKSSATLILVDLVENFEAQKVHSWPLRLLMRAAGILDPHGSAPRDYRLTFLRTRGEFAQNVPKLLDWRPDKVIMAHGRPYMENADVELRRAFRWVKGGD